MDNDTRPDPRPVHMSQDKATAWLIEARSPNVVSVGDEIKYDLGDLPSGAPHVTTGRIIEVMPQVVAEMEWRDHGGPPIRYRIIRRHQIVRPQSSA